MASPVPKIDQVIISEDFNKRMHRRIRAAWYYYSGTAKRQWLANETKELQPWRIVRYTHVVNPKLHPIPIKRSDFVLPDTFRYHLYYFKRHFHVVSLEDLLGAIERGERLPRNTLAITFDCGYRSFYDHAFPLLQRFDIPATVFLPTAFISTENFFWSDKVTIGLLLLQQYKFPFPKFSKLPGNFFTVLEQISGTTAITDLAIGVLLDALYEMPAADRMHTLGELGVLLDGIGGFPRYRTFLTWEEVERISYDKRIRFASMTHNHNVASELEPNELKSDLEHSFTSLEKFKPLKNVISLPHGYEDAEIRKHFEALSIRYLLVRGLKLHEKVSPTKVGILGRVSLFDDASFCTEFLACRLWGSSFGAYRF